MDPASQSLREPMDCPATAHGFAFSSEVSRNPAGPAGVNRHSGKPESRTSTTTGECLAPGGINSSTGCLEPETAAARRTTRSLHRSRTNAPCACSVGTQRRRQQGASVGCALDNR